MAQVPSGQNALQYLGWYELLVEGGETLRVIFRTRVRRLDNETMGAVRQPSRPACRELRVQIEYMVTAALLIMKLVPLFFVEKRVI